MSKPSFDFDLGAPAATSNPYVIEPTEKARLAEQQARGTATLEKLRYRHYARTGQLGQFMQRLGDWGRKLFS